MTAEARVAVAVAHLTRYGRHREHDSWEHGGIRLIWESWAAEFSSAARALHEERLAKGVASC